MARQSVPQGRGVLRCPASRTLKCAGQRDTAGHRGTLVVKSLKLAGESVPQVCVQIIVHAVVVQQRVVAVEQEDHVLSGIQGAQTLASRFGRE